MKKSLKIALAILAAAMIIAGLIAAVAAAVHKAKYYYYEMSSYEVHDFSEHKASFALVAKRLAGFYRSQKEKDDGAVSMTLESVSDGKWKLRFQTADSEPYFAEADASEVDIEAYREVVGAFNKGIYEYNGLLFIKVTDDQVIFFTGTRYRVIHTFNGWPPDDEENSMFVDRLSHGWYQVMLC